jgi:hypothetical protein
MIRDEEEMEKRWKRDEKEIEPNTLFETSTFIFSKSSFFDKQF